MRPEIVSKDDLSNILQERRITTTAQLVQQFGCTPKTIFRKLRSLGYVTSYNKNRVGITLATIPEFDEHGLWGYGPYIFSRWGTLYDTIQHAVEDSPAGLSAGELGKLLHVNVYHHVSTCVRKARIHRDPSRRPPVYYHRDPVARREQQRRRRALLEEATPERPHPVSKENVIKILVTVITHHAATIEKLMPVLEAEGVHISEQSVRWVLRRYEIGKKKSP